MQAFATPLRDSQDEIDAIDVSDAEADASASSNPVPLRPHPPRDEARHVGSTDESNIRETSTTSALPDSATSLRFRKGQKLTSAVDFSDGSDESQSQELDSQANLSSENTTQGSLTALELKKKGQAQAHAQAHAELKSSQGSSSQTQKRSAISRFFSAIKSVEFLLGIFFLVAGILTRCLFVARGNRVIWDEAHFGKFASHYIKQTFYTDVHPPLGKTLLGLAGYWAGYNGTFTFESGATYPTELNYSVMRLFCAFWGALIVPLAYLSSRNLGLSRPAAFTAATGVLFENAFTVISRFILLDSMLLFCTALGFYFWTNFVRIDYTEPSKRGSAKWWAALALVGLGLGLVSSVKWVGLFLVALVGLHTLENLWGLLADTSLTVPKYIYHWIARAICLIAVPVTIYLLSFKLHFAILVNSGPGDSQMSSLFQANLNGSDLKDAPLEIAYGSKITLRSNGAGGGILHSHVQTYPQGSKQQQITCYHHRDLNNIWIVDMPRKENDKGDLNSLLPLEAIPRDKPRFLQHGDVIRLVHEATGRNLHSHPVAAPVSKRYYEVSGYGNKSLGDIHDNWVVEYSNDALRSNSELMRQGAKLHVLTTRIRLRHQITGCLLRSDQRSLPEWGFKQHEVTCDKSPPSKSRNNSVNNLWNIEQHWNPVLPKAKGEMFPRSFIDDFINVNAGMWSTNNALVPDPEKEPDGLTSSPFDWPLLLGPLRICSWGDADIKFMMMGNPIVWWLAAGSVAGFAVVLFVYLAMHQRQIGSPWSEQQWRDFYFVGKWLTMGWGIHYIPFMLMGRVLYLHHYFPALYFGIILTAFMLQHLTARLPKEVQLAVYLVLNVAIAATFVHFAPITYGYDKPASEFAKNRQWLQSWRLAN